MKQRLRELSWTVSFLLVFLYKKKYHSISALSLVSFVKWRGYAGILTFWDPYVDFSHALDIFPTHLWLLAEFKKMSLNAIQSVFIYFVSLAVLVTRVPLSCFSSALNRKSVYGKNDHVICLVEYVMGLDTVCSFSAVLFFFKANLC